jgi:hypothetical protein
MNTPDLPLFSSSSAFLICTNVCSLARKQGGLRHVSPFLMSAKSVLSRPLRLRAVRAGQAVLAQPRVIEFERRCVQIQVNVLRQPPGAGGGRGGPGEFCRARIRILLWTVFVS